MLTIDSAGRVVDQRVVLALRPAIERGPLKLVRGIVVHQTGGSTAKSALSSYTKANAMVRIF